MRARPGLLPVLAGLLALVPAATRPDNWADDKDAITADYVRSKAICHQIGDRSPPAADRPAPAQRAALKTCNAEALYYGEDGAPDYVKARQCAFAESDAGQGTDRADAVFAGDTILMQIYANGLGVKRDLDQAIAYACQIDGAPAEIDGRVMHLAAMKSEAAPKRFDYCDDITSGLGEGNCAAREATLTDKTRDARLARLKASLPPAARSAFAALETASETFVSAHDGEVDESGTARAAEVIGEEEATRDTFLKHVRDLLAGRWPAAGATQAGAADAALNLAYRKALAALASKDNLTTVKPADARTAQRAWLPYRDAFVRFAAVAPPTASRNAIIALLTRERTEMLEDLAN